MGERDIRIMLSRLDRDDLRLHCLAPWVEASEKFTKGQLMQVANNLVRGSYLISAKWVKRPSTMPHTIFSGCKVIEMCYRYNGKGYRATFPPKGRGGRCCH